MKLFKLKADSGLHRTQTPSIVTIYNRSNSQERREMTLSLAGKSILRVASQHLDSPPHKMPCTAQQPRSRKIRIPSVLMRCGTSRALFFHRRDLPADKESWSPILLSVMGSADGDERQLNGVGGGSSTTSKVAIVEKSTRPGVDVEYTFVQVPVGGGKLDLSGNCGNVCSGVGPFAVDEGLVDTPKKAGSKVMIRTFNTNTNQLIIQTIEVDEDGAFQSEGDTQIGGFAGSGSRIDVKFLRPAGTMTGVLFPSDRREQWLHISSHDISVRVTCIDAANPFIFVDKESLPEYLRILPPTAVEVVAVTEDIRCAGAVVMGLAASITDASQRRGTPKIAFLSPSVKEDVAVQAYSMGKPHPSLQLTGAVCLGVALCVPGTVAYRLSLKSGRRLFREDSLATSPLEIEEQLPTPSDQPVHIAHPTGEMEVMVSLETRENGHIDVEYGSVVRTARRIFYGNMLVNLP